MNKKEKEELVEELFGNAFRLDGTRFPPRLRKPGQIVESLSKETREKLSELTAEDFNHRQK